MPPFFARRSTRIRGSRGRRRGEDLADVGRGRGVVDEAELPVAEALPADRADHRRSTRRRAPRRPASPREAGRRHPAQPRLSLRRSAASFASRPGSRGLIRLARPCDPQRAVRSARRPGPSAGPVRCRCRSAGRAGGGSPRRAGRTRLRCGRAPAAGLCVSSSARPVPPAWRAAPAAPRSPRGAAGTRSRRIRRPARPASPRGACRAPPRG